ncbi:MAG TPA: CoA-transferase [Xanthobacteraceae bacterium]|nr:CoA-transferase [Xanthobacteraceae bacterium]
MSEAAAVQKHKFMRPLEEQAPRDLRRRSKLTSLEEAGRIIASKKTVSLAGSHSADAAMSLLRAAIRAGAKNMTMIPPVTTSIAADLPIAAGMLGKLYLSYVGFEVWGMAPAFRRAAETKSLDIVEADEPFILLGTQAAAGGRPFNAVQYLYEATDHPRLNPELKKITDPYSGREVYLIPPLKSDVFIMHAQACDEFGNAQVWGGSGQERDKAKAADLVIVQTDQIVGGDVIQRDPGKTTIPGLWVDHVVHVPFGAHPTFSSFNYGLDEQHIKLYLAMVREGRAAEYIDKYVHGPKDHFEYLELVGGMPRMTELQNMLAVERQDRQSQNHGG